MGGAEEEGSMLGALEPGRRLDAGGNTEGDRSILADLNHIRDHIAVLEEAARVARAVEFDQIRAVVEQLEVVAAAARAVERDLAAELSDTNRLSVATARFLRDRLGETLQALAEALGAVERSG